MQKEKFEHVREIHVNLVEQSIFIQLDAECAATIEVVERADDEENLLFVKTPAVPGILGQV
jgi:hypothetical protein